MLSDSEYHIINFGKAHQIERRATDLGAIHLLLGAGINVTVDIVFFHGGYSRGTV